MEKKKSFWQKPAQEMTIGDSLKFTGIVSVASFAPLVIAMGVSWIAGKVQERKMKKETKEK